MRRSRCIDELVSGLAAHQPELDRASTGVYLSSNECGLCSATFVNAARSPIAIGKFAVRASEERVIVREHDVLTRLHDSGGDASRRAPKPIGVSKLSPGLVAYYSVVPGRPAQASEVVLDDVFVSQIVEWLAQLHNCLRQDVVLDEATFDALITEPAKAVLAQSGVDDSFHAALDNGIALAKQMVGESMPLVLAHGDLWARNVLINADRSDFHVIDWDLAETGRFPLGDVFHWFFHNALEHYRIDWIDAAAMCARSGGKYGRLFRSGIASYCEALGWRPKHFGPLMTAHFIYRKAAPLLRYGLQWSPASNHEWVFTLPRVWQIAEDLGRALEEAGWDASKGQA